MNRTFVDELNGVALWDVTDKLAAVDELAFVGVHSHYKVFTHQVWATSDLSFLFVNDDSCSERTLIRMRFSKWYQ